MHGFDSSHLLFAYAAMLCAACERDALAPAGRSGADVKAIIDVLCDSPVCNERTLADTVRPILQESVGKPGYGVQLWMLGATASETRQVGRPLRFSPAARKDKRSIENANLQFVTNAIATVVESAAPYLSSPRTASPLAESIVRIGMSEPKAHIVVISDARETTQETADFECRPPAPKSWAKALKRLRLFEHNSMPGVRIDFVHTDLTPVDKNRCKFSMRKLIAIQQLWADAAKSAGASVQFHRGNMNLPQQVEK